MLTLHTSHRLESLADALAGVLGASPAPPLIAETVVVQSLGMRRWLSYQLAERLGVAMNIRFPFPADFAGQIFVANLGEKPSPVFHRDALPWRIQAALPSMLADVDFRDLKRYVDDDPLRLWQLSAQIAATFDRYIAHRPDILLRWDKRDGIEEERWQAKLWQKIARGHAHPAAMLARLDRRPAPGDAVQDEIAVGSGRCCIFGLSSLAPVYLELLAALTDRAEFHLFLLAPTREYWGDIRSEREQARLARWREKHGHHGELQPFEQGHPLLASLGKVGREFHEAILDLTPGDEPDYFEATPPKTALTQLQHDMLTLSERGPLPLTQDDRSIQFHNCHSPLRELEVLHDQLLALVESDATIEPRDILVAVPDIEAYAPFIEAVFGAPESDALRFPYSIADRTLRAESSVADAFLRLLDVVESRFAATEILALLDAPAIRERFRISEGDLALIRRWVVSTGIRWGRDAAHRDSLDLPASEENTWRFGIERLLLGFALPGDGTTLFKGILPSPEIEGALADTLGCFAMFCDQLFSRIPPIASPRNAAEWSRDLRELLDAFCSGNDDFATQWREVASNLATIGKTVAIATQDIGGAETAIPFSVIQRHFTAMLSDTDRGSGFLRGGVTFCSLRPMRAIPHRVVCLLGLNDGAFPRRERPPAFDLTAAHPRPGDRSVRDDDRQLFLEAILSARDTLYVSWCGQSPNDNSPIPPSVVVSELMDHLARVFTPSPAITKHRLQAFSAAYFSGGDLFSYSVENAAASRAATSARIMTPPFATVLPPLVAGQAPFDLPFTSLVDSLLYPARFFARDCLGLRLPGEDPAPEDVEPITLGGLESYQIVAQLTEAQLGGTDAAALLPALTATGTLPHGYAGRSEFNDAAALARALAKAAEHHAPGQKRDPLLLTTSVGDWRISGTLRVITDSALLHLRPASVKARDLLRAWLNHLVLCIAAPSTFPRRSVIIGKDAAFAFDGISNGKARDVLASLLEYHVRAKREALPLFTESSLTFAEYKLNLGGSLKADPLLRASACWVGSKFTDARAERDDEWNALVWRGVANPLGDAFQKLAIAIFEPLLRHRIALPPVPPNK